MITLSFIGLVSSTAWYWDTAVQYNADEYYNTTEGTGWTTAIAILNNDSSVTLAGTFTMHSGNLPQFADLADIIATNGTSEELERELTQVTGFTINQTANDTWEFGGTLINPVLPTEDGHFEVALFSFYNSGTYFFFVNTSSLIDGHYLPSTIANESTTTLTTTSTTTTSTSITAITACPMPGDYPPCSEVTLAEVIDFINQWAADNAELSEVIDLINAWAAG